MQKNVKRIVATLLAFVLAFTSMDITGLRAYADDATDPVAEVMEDVSTGETLDTQETPAPAETEEEIGEEEEEAIVENNFDDGASDPDALAFADNIVWGDENTPNTLPENPEFHNGFGMEVGRDRWFGIGEYVYDADEPDENGARSATKIEGDESSNLHIYDGETLLEGGYIIEYKGNNLYTLRMSSVGDYQLKYKNYEHGLDFNVSLPTVGFYTSNSATIDNLVFDPMTVEYGESTTLYVIPNLGENDTLDEMTWEVQSDGQWIKNSPTSFSGGSISKNPSDNFATVSLDGTAWVALQFDVSITRDGQQDQDKNGNFLNVELSNKGLVYTDCWDNSLNGGQGGIKTVDSDIYNTWSTYRKYDTNWTEGDERNIQFAICSKDSVNEDDAIAFENDLNVDTSKFYVKVLNGTTEADPAKGDCDLYFNSQSGYWSFRANTPGTYRIHSTSLESGNYYGSDFVQITVNAQTDFMGIYLDKDCKNPAELSNEDGTYPGALSAGGVTLYAKAWSNDENKTVSIIGYSLHNDRYNLPDQISKIYSVNSTHDGVNVSTPDENDVVTITVSDEYLDNIRLYAKFEQDDNVYYWDRDVWIQPSNAGLTAIDEIDYEDHDGNLDINSLNIRNNDRRKNFGSCVFDRKYVIFATCDDPDAANPVYVPVTDAEGEGLTAKIRNGSEWKDVTDELGLKYVGDIEGLVDINEDYAGLWLVTSPVCGDFRIYASDNTFVEFNVSEPNIGFYLDADCTELATSWNNNIINKNGLTLYTKINNFDNQRVEAFYGYALGNPDVWGNDGLDISKVDAVKIGFDGKDHNGVTISAPNNKGVAQITISAGYYDNIRVFATLSRNGEIEEYWDRDIWVNEDPTGLAVLDWLNCWDWNGDYPVYSKISIGYNEDEQGNKNYARYNKGFGRSVGDNSVILLGYLTNPEADSNDYSQYEVVDKDVAVKKYNGETWENTDYVELEYIGYNDGIEDTNIAGHLWRIRASKVGSYRLYYSDGSYVTLDVSLPRVGLYDASTVAGATGETIISGGDVNFDAVCVTSYLVYAQDDANEGFKSAEITSITVRLHNYNAEFWYNLKKGGWYELIWNDDDKEYDYTDTPSPEKIVLPNVTILSNAAVKVDLFTSNIELRADAKFVYDGNNEDDGRQWNFRMFEKGLVYTDNYDWDQYNGSFIEVEGEGDDARSNYRKTDTWYAGDDRPMRFAISDSDTLFADFSPKYVADLNKDSSVYTISKLEDSEWVPTDDFVLYYRNDDGRNELNARGNAPGTYRIYSSYAASVEGGAYSNCNFVQINIVEPTEKFGAYTDAACTKPAFLTDLSGNEYPGFYVSDDETTFYVKAWSEEAYRTMSIIGYIIEGEDEINWGDEQDIARLHPVGETTEGVTVSKPNANGVVTVTVPEGYEGRVRFSASLEFEKDNGRTETRDYDVWFNKNMKGLLVIDWIEVDRDWEGQPMFETARFGYDNPDNFARYNKGMGRNVNDEVFVVFGYNNEDSSEVSSDRNLYRPVTSGLSVLVKDGKDWLPSNDIVLEYVGENENLPEGFTGLWMINPQKVGEYRIVYTDGTYVDVSARLPRVALFDTDSLANVNESTFVTDGPYYVPGELDTYILQVKDNFDDEERVISQDAESISVIMDGNYYYYDGSGWKQYQNEDFEPADDDVAAPEDVVLPTIEKLNPLDGAAYKVKVTTDRFDLRVVGKYTIFDFHDEHANEDVTHDEHEERWFWFDQDQTGLVVNANGLEIDYSDWHATGKIDDYSAFGKFNGGINTTYISDFALGINSSYRRVQTAEDVDLLTSLTDLTVKKFDKGIETDAASVVTLKYNEKTGLFSFKATEAGEYRIYYKDGSFVTFEVIDAKAFFYSDATFTEAYECNEEVDATLQEAVEEKTTLYFWVKQDEKTYPETGALKYATFDVVTYGDEANDPNDDTIQLFDIEKINEEGYLKGLADKGIVVTDLGNGKFKMEISVVEGGLLSTVIRYYQLGATLYYGERKNDKGETEYCDDFYEWAGMSVNPARATMDDIDIVLDPDVDCTNGVTKEAILNNAKFTYKGGSVYRPLKDTNIYVSSFSKDFSDNSGIVYFKGEDIDLEDLPEESDICAIITGTSDVHNFVIPAATESEFVGFYTDSTYSILEGKDHDFTMKDAQAKKTTLYFMIDQSARTTGGATCKNYTFELLAGDSVLYDSVTGTAIAGVDVTDLGEGKYSAELSVAEGGLTELSGTYKLNVTMYYAQKEISETLTEYDCVFWETTTVKIGKVSISDFDLSQYSYTFTYDGKAHTVEPVVSYKGTTLVAETDYTVDYDDNVTVGTHTITIKGTGSYTGTLSATMKITPADISTATIKRVVGSKEEDIPATTTFSDINTNGMVISVKIGDVTIVKDKDYVYDFTNAVGKQALTIEGKGNYKGTVVKQITVNADNDLSRAIVTVNNAKDYTGSVITFSDSDVTVTLDGKTVDPEFYTVTTASIAAGTGKLTVTGNADKGYKGSKTATFTINAVAFEKLTVTAAETSVTYNPKGYDENIVVKLGEKVLVKGTDYTIGTYTTGVGEKTVTLTGKGSITGTADVSFTVTAASAANWDVSGIVTTYYVEKAADKAKPQIEIKYEGTTLVKDMDYTVTIDGAAVTELSTGSHTLTVTGKDNFTGSVEKTISVATYNKVSLASITLEQTSATYMGTEIKPAVARVVDAEGNTVSASDYNLFYADNIEPGKATVYAVAKAESLVYEGAVATTFQINPIEVADCDVDVIEPGHLDNTGKKIIKPEYAIYYGEEALEEGVDYTVKFDKLKAGKTATAKVTFKGYYTGSVTKEFGTVLGYEVEKISCSDYSDLTYNGNDLKQKLTVNATYYSVDDVATGTKKLKEGTDFEIKYYDADDNTLVGDSVKLPGTYYAEFTGIGKYYSGTSIRVNAGYFFDVKKGSVAKATIKLASNSVKYSDGEVARKIAVSSVKIGNTTLEKDVDYTISYLNTDKPGKATVVITGCGYYDDTISATKDYDITGKQNIATDCVHNVGAVAVYSPAGSFPAVSITIDGEELVAGKDYTLSANKNKVGDTATLTVKGKGQYEGKFTEEFSIIKANLNDDAYVERVSFAKATKIGDDYWLLSKYTGKALTIDPQIKVDGKALKLDTDYTVAFTDNNGTAVSEVVNSGDYTLTITGKGDNFEGTLGFTVRLHVQPEDVSKLAITTAAKEYDEAGISNSVTKVVFGKGKNAVTLTEGVDYKVDYEYEYANAYDVDLYKDFGIREYAAEQTGYTVDNVTPGKTTAYVIGMGNFAGVKAAAYTINGIKVSKLTVKVSKFTTLDIYDDDETVSDHLSVSYKKDKNSAAVELVEGIDYVIDDDGVEYADAAKLAGNHSIVITGLGKYSGTQKFKYTIGSVKLTDVNARLVIEDNTYTCSAKGTQIDLSDISVAYGVNKSISLAELAGSVKLTYKNNKKAADKTAKKAPMVTVNFGKTGFFTGSLKDVFTIVPANITVCDIITGDVYTTLDKKGYASKYKANLTIYDDAGNKLAEKTHYTLTYFYAENTLVYDSGAKNYVVRNAGTAVNAKDKLKTGTKLYVEITGKGNFRGTATSEDFYLIKK
ncbi:MAG: hypothetical protein K6A74_09815 [Lachnospiraceae bacterium]|nr:hypothetical protein [Lachnospiraceae bacterium]